MSKEFFVYRSRIIKSVGFLGIGKSNIAIYNYLSSHFQGFNVTVRNSQEINFSPIKAERVFFGRNSLSHIDEDILFLSPSARRDKKEISEAKKRGVILSSDTEFFFSISSKDVYAITGSDGKSTTTYLTSRLLSKKYQNAIPCANIGTPMTPYLDCGENNAFVAELSSFQLMYQQPKSLRCVITNISKNHLDWHKSYEEYISAKANILKNSKERILNYDCEISRNLAKDYSYFAVYSAIKTEKELKNLINSEIYITLENGAVTACGEKILDVNKIKLLGRHNIMNFMSAIALSYGKCDEYDIQELAESFGGLEHRCEFVENINDIDYYNSSIDSSPKRCIQTLGMLDRRVILILGGRSKGLDFSELIPALISKTKQIILTGECAEEIENILCTSKDFLNSEIKYCKMPNFYSAIDCAIASAMPGDTILLSPAATSYDSFKSFEERGRAFKDYIKSFKTKGL